MSPLLFRLSDGNFVCMSKRPHAYYMFNPYHSPQQYHIWRSSQIVKLLVTECVSRRLLTCFLVGAGFLRRILFSKSVILQKWRNAGYNKIVGANNNVASVTVCRCSDNLPGHCRSVPNVVRPQTIQRYSSISAQYRDCRSIILIQDFPVVSVNIWT